MNIALSVGSDLAATVTDRRTTGTKQLTNTTGCPIPGLNFPAPAVKRRRRDSSPSARIPSATANARLCPLCGARSRRCPTPSSMRRSARTRCYLPFDLDDVAHNLHTERYTSAESASSMQRLIRNAYYYLRPRLAVGVRKYLQRAYLSGWKSIRFPSWPLDRSVDQLMKRALLLGIQASGATRCPSSGSGRKDTAAPASLRTMLKQRQAGTSVRGSWIWTIRAG